MYNENGIEEVVTILMRREHISREDALLWVYEALEKEMEDIDGK